ncbi:hypothetical protein [Actinokineospora pegani]|uniref:hypothetical protein n=1 Tax=Actinokineospora pegani TaxID=2654637 RepID=UPI0012EA00D3|nr:hypothetical protein [Actinokineospora pegani]
MTSIGSVVCARAARTSSTRGTGRPWSGWGRLPPRRRGVERGPDPADGLAGAPVTAGLGRRGPTGPPAEHVGVDPPNTVLGA